MIRLSLFMVVVLHGTNISHGKERDTSSSKFTDSSSHHDGLSYELIQDKLNIMESRFSEFLTQLKEQAKSIQKQMETAEKQITAVVDHQKQTNIDLNRAVESALGNDISLVSDQITKLQTSSSQHDRILEIIKDVQLCSKPSERLQDWCLKNWLIVLQRLDGSENFNRNWTDYRDGFGTVGQEFWLGLEQLHEITKSDTYEVLFELEDFAGKYRYARYRSFSIGSEAELYRMKELGAYSGTAGDSFTYHKGKHFAAFDKGGNTKCVQKWTGGWWYGNCFQSHLTGNWNSKNDWKSINWKNGPEDKTAYKFARMMIRKK